MMKNSLDTLKMVIYKKENVQRKINYSLGLSILIILIMFNFMELVTILHKNVLRKDFLIKDFWTDMVILKMTFESI